MFASWLAGSVLIAAACTASGDEALDASPESDAPTNSASSIQVAPEDIEDPSAAAVAAYERYWRAVAEATAISDPSSEALVEAASDSALETAQSIVNDAVTAGEHSSGQPTHDAEVTESYPVDAPSRFVVSDCMDTSDWLLIDDESGEPVPSEEYGTHQVDALVEQVDEVWRVTEVVILELGSCLGKPADP